MCLGVPGEIISISEASGIERQGRVSFGGVEKEVNLSCVPEAKVGDYVIVHVGFALSVVDRDEAQRVFEYLKEMEELTQLENRGEAAEP